MIQTPANSSFPEKPIKAPGTLIWSIAICLSGCGVILVIGGLLMWFNHAYPARRNDNFRPAISPNGNHQALLFRRTSPDDKSFTTHVTIIRSGKKRPSNTGNALIAQGEPSVIVRWIDNSRLVIDDPDGTKVIFRASQVGDVQISDH